MLIMAWYSKTYTLVTSVHNNLDNADDAGNADNYNRVIGISKCEQEIANTLANKHTNPPTHEHTHSHTDIWVGHLQ